MRLGNQVDDGVQIVRIQEQRLDASFADDFVSAVSDLIARGPQAVVIDLTAVDFIDSRGLGAILALYKSVVPAGKFVISGARETILSLLRLTRIDNIIPVYATEQEAVAALRRSPPSTAVADA